MPDRATPASVAAPDTDRDTLAPLHAALRDAPRRYRMPPLPADAAAAEAAGAETALAFALEGVRTATAAGHAPPEALRAVFTNALHTLIRKAMAPEGGDPAFQAQVLRLRAPAVDTYARLAAQARQDARALRTAVNALAHPARLAQRPPGALRERLAQLHAHAVAHAWAELRQAAEALAAERLDEPLLCDTLARLLARPALARMAQRAALQGDVDVRRYRALVAQRGPLAASAAAAAQGRASARAGAAAEAQTLAAFAGIAEHLNTLAPADARFHAVHGLRNPLALPAADKAKGEWDVVLLRDAAGSDAADLVLVAEVKASPAAAAPDLPRLLRGLATLAAADGSREYRFRSTRGELLLRGASLRRLQPKGRHLPPHAIYCSAADEPVAPMLSAAARAVLMAEPASLALGAAIAVGDPAAPDSLEPVWQALHAPRLRTAVHQYDTARAVREVMLHPQDLLAALERAARL